VIFVLNLSESGYIYPNMSVSAILLGIPFHCDHSLRNGLLPEPAVLAMDCSNVHTNTSLHAFYLNIIEKALYTERIQYYREFLNQK
jgi:hypothetical protein